MFKKQKDWLKHRFRARKKPTFRENVQIADQTVMIVSNLDFLDINPGDYFSASSKEHDAVLAILHGDCKSAMLEMATKRMYITLDDQAIQEREHMCVMRMAAAYLTDLLSDKYDSVHGCGMVVCQNERPYGLLFVGRSGSHKSHLRRQFDDYPHLAGGHVIWERAGNNTTLDDDIMLVDGKDMHLVGTTNSVWVKKQGRNYIYYRNDGLTKATIDQVFLLDRQKPAGYIRETQREIPRSIAVFDQIEDNSCYIKKEPIKVSAPVYNLGTNGDLAEAKRAIEEVLAQGI